MHRPNSDCHPAMSYLGEDIHLEELVLQSHIVLRLKTDAGTEDVSESSTLLGESVDNGGARWGERSLMHISMTISNFVALFWNIP